MQVQVQVQAARHTASQPASQPASQRAHPSVVECPWLSAAPIAAPMWMSGPSGPTGRPLDTTRPQDTNFTTRVAMLNTCIGMCKRTGMQPKARSGRLELLCPVLPSELHFSDLEQAKGTITGICCGVLRMRATQRGMCPPAIALQQMRSLNPLVMRAVQAFASAAPVGGRRASWATPAAGTYICRPERM